MSKTFTLTCIECDHEVEVQVLRSSNEGLNYEELIEEYDYPDDCPNCNEPFNALEDGSDDYREDFHSDG